MKHLHLPSSRRLAAFFGLLIFTSFSVVAPAWSRGGGHGGGHGGGFGGGGFGGGGYHSYYGGGGYGGGYYGGYYGHPYYGNGYYGRGYSSGPDYFFDLLILIVVIVAISHALGNSSNGSKTLVVVTLLLKDGQQYTTMLNGFTTRARLDTPSERTFAAHEVVHLIRETDILIGHYQKLDSSTDSMGLGMEAKAIWQGEMSAANLKSDVINVSSPGQKMRAQFGAPAYDPESTGTAEEGYCLVTIIASASGFWPQSSSDRDTIVSAVHRLGSASIDVLYFYFTPSAGLSMSRNEAISLLERLRGAI